MKKIALAMVSLAALCAPPAYAQYGGPYGGYGSGYDGGRDGYGRSQSRRDFDEDDDDGPRYRRRVDPYGSGRSFERRSAAGSVCITARGNCLVGGPRPQNSPCSCEIPGFGTKRGAIGGGAAY